MAEWLRRSPAKRTTVQVGKRLGSARVSSNLILVEFFLICLPFSGLESKRYGIYLAPHAVIDFCVSFFSARTRKGTPRRAAENQRRYHPLELAV